MRSQIAAAFKGKCNLKEAFVSYVTIGSLELTFLSKENVIGQHMIR
jgi:hypothetical protein